METWKAIDGYEGYYEVSTLGRVRSVDRIDCLGRLHRSRILSQGYDGRKAYLHVILSCKGVHKTINVHRLVATAFLPNPSGYSEVNHKDENKTNNCVKNLEWCDKKYNNNYGTKIARQSGENNPRSKYDDVTVRFIKDNHVLSGGEMTTTELSKRLGVSLAHVSSIAHGRRRRLA